uniref:Uncharacterized protein n=1 Tax=Panagrolaimus sp. JU765 TaxID=591449 RepID=A0AC34R7J5_9BILA
CVTRKFVIPIIEALLDLEKNTSYQKLLLEKLQDFCRDPTLAVRKLGAEAMTRVVRDERVYKKAWLHTVLPMMNDRDDSVEKTCRKMFFDKIVHPIVENKGTDSLSWNLVIEIAKSSSFKRALRTCFRSVAKDAENKSLLNKLAKVLYGSVKVDAVAKPAWMLLDYLADELDIDVLIAVHAWIASDKSVKDVDPAVRITTDPLELLSILSVILKKHNSLKEEDKVAFRNNLALRIAACELPPPVISDAIIAFAGVFSGPEFRIWGELVNECYRGLLTATEDEKAEKS